MAHDARIPDPARLSRRRFLTAGLGAALVAAIPGPARAAAALGARAGASHPDPRPGVDASRVLTAEQLARAPHAVPVFDAVREIPHIADGLRCYCGCAELDGYRSLLSCFEGVGMALYCEICQGQALLAHSRWKEGQTLDQIRRATDARFALDPDTGPGRHRCA